jgi:hypothetical protein
LALKTTLNILDFIEKNTKNGKNCLEKWQILPGTYLRSKRGHLEAIFAKN